MDKKTECTTVKVKTSVKQEDNTWGVYLIKDKEGIREIKGSMHNPFPGLATGI